MYIINVNYNNTIAFLVYKYQFMICIESGERSNVGLERKKNISVFNNFCNNCS